MSAVINSWLQKYESKFSNSEDKYLVLNYLNLFFKNKKSINFSFNQAIEKAKKWNQSLKSSGEVLLVFESEQYQIVKLIDNVSINYDSFYMKNCLVSYKGGDIYSLRTKLNIPRSNMEIIDNEIIQIKGPANSNLSRKYIPFVIDFIKSKSLKVKESTLNEMGYFKLSENTQELLENNFTGFDWMFLDSQKYFNSNSKINLKKPFNESCDELFLFLVNSCHCDQGINLLLKNGISHETKELGFKLISKNNKKEILELLLENYTPTSSMLKEAVKSCSIAFIKEIIHIFNLKSIPIHEFFLTESIKGNNFSVVNFLIKNYFKSNKNYLLLALSQKKVSLRLLEILVDENNIDPLQDDGRALFYAMAHPYPVFNYLFNSVKDRINNQKRVELIRSIPFLVEGDKNLFLSLIKS